MTEHAPAGLPADYPPAPAMLPASVVDTHTHLDMGTDGHTAHAPDSAHVAALVHAAGAVGVTAVVQVGCDVAGSKWSAEVAELFPHVWAAVALHPNEAPRIFADGGPQALEDACGEIADLAALPQVRAVGETGMDFYRTGADGRVAQEASFRAHIDIAKRTGKALVVHDREAHADVLRILDEVGAPDRVVLHCFSGDAEFAQEAVRRGYFCSFAGVLTFKNAHDLRAALQVVPAELLLVETDGPFLTPAPYRGRTNSSYLMPLTVRAIAEQRDWALVDTCELLYSNAERAFGAL